MATRSRPADPAPRALHVAEPPPRYGQHPPAVVDASLIAALVFAEPEQAAAAQSLVHCRPVAPELLPYELANVAVNKLRRGHAEEAVRASLVDLGSLGIELHAVAAPLVFELAARYGLTAYDAAYLALAGRLRCSLLTFDARLAAAGRQHLGSAE
jgi:predicted nucleic acid-binding protein